MATVTPSAASAFADARPNPLDAAATAARRPVIPSSMASTVDEAGTGRRRLPAPVLCNAVTGPFDDLLAANRASPRRSRSRGFDGVAHAGVAIVTCMDSRIDPLRMLGLQPGDAKIFRNPGGRVTDAALEALVLGVHLLGVDRILVVPHTRCAMATHTEDELRSADQRVQRAGRLVAVLRRDRRPARRPPGGRQDPPRRTRSIPDTVAIGGFLYDVDTGLLEHEV